MLSSKISYIIEKEERCKMGDYASCYKNTIWAALRLESE